MPVDVRMLGALLLWGWLSAPAGAQTPPAGAEAGVEENMEFPSLELLEFLGEWETADGEWIDPEELDDLPLTDQEQSDVQQ